MFETTESIVATIVMFVVFSVVTGLLATRKAKKTSTEIGQVRCNRCGYVAAATAGTQFRLFKGMEGKLRCTRCGSEDWSTP